MLSSSKIGTGSWRYYANQVQHGACEYFLGIGEAPGRWQGRGLDALGLEPKAVVSERELEGLFGRALHPTSRQQLGNAWRSDGVTGYDLCFSAPKSVSALWAIGDGNVPEHVMAAHRAAIAAALTYLDGHAAFSRVGTNGHTQVGTDGFAAAVFGHRTSRAGDPQLHAHALVVNKVRCPDGEWRTIDGHEIYAHKKSAGVVYQAALRAELTHRLGVAWTPVTKDGQAEIAGMPRELTKLWSKRDYQIAKESAPVIAAYEAKLGRELTSAERTAVQKVAVLKTRPDKEPVDIVALADRWETEATALGWDRTAVTLAVRTAGANRANPTTASVVAQMDQAVIDAVAAAGARRAVFTRSDLAAEVAARMPVGRGMDADFTRTMVEQLTDQALDSPETVGLKPHTDGPVRASDARYASRATLDAEMRIVGVADAGKGAGVAMLGQQQVRAIAMQRGLDPSQQVALVRVTGSGDQVSVLVAPAGTGKTTALAAAVQAWQSAGYELVLLAPSARAAAELRDATGVRADTVAKFLHEHDQPHRQANRWDLHDPYQLSRVSVVIVDEASMLPTQDMDRLTAAGWAAGSKLLLVGDPAQIGAVDAAGGMLPAVVDRIGAQTLEQVHRFTEPWERRASLQLRSGDPAAVEQYAAAGRIHDCPDEHAAYTAVHDKYVEATSAGRRALMLARTHRDVDALNTLARSHAIDTGDVRGPVLADGELQWRAGDRLRATRNNRSVTVGADFLRNGDQFTVTGTDHHGLTVQAVDGRGTTRLPAEYVNEHAAYGWASTVDAAQGATVDDGVLLARPGLDREHLYVGLTRGRHSNDVYVAPRTAEIDHHIPPRPDDARSATEIIRDALATSDQQHAAHTQLPDHERSEPTRPRDPAGLSADLLLATIADPTPEDRDRDNYYLYLSHATGHDRGRGGR
jgi:conjugative relaxase-like TrwC/TraI family protein